MEKYTREDFKSILKEKQEKIKRKAPKKFPYSWNNNQLNVMADIMYGAPRIRIEDKVYRFSILNDSDLIYNDFFLTQLFKHYY